MIIIVFGLIGGIIIASLVVVIFHYRNLNLKKELEWQTKFQELESKMHSMELQTINSKLNPHLFKNILNSIQSHAYQTYYSLDKLSNVLDFILYESDRKYVSLKEEVDFALNLIEINRLKLGPLFDLRIKNKISSEELEGRLSIAPLLTIDLIENAFKHADIHSEDAFISIVFELKNSQFSITVSNKISRKPFIQKTNSGIGKDSLKKRLEILYPGNFTMDQFTENDVYIAHLKINLIEQNNQMPVAG